MLDPKDYPASLMLDAARGLIEPCSSLVQRRVSDLKMMFYDPAAAEQAISGGDPVVYEIRTVTFLTSKSDLALAITRIVPGVVGDEYYMSKGHEHQRDDQAEIYYCLHGQGYLLLDTLEGDFRAEPWQAGVVTHIPPMWAHRAVNTGPDDLVYAGFYRLSAGHLYDRVARQGFAKVVIRREGRPFLTPRAEAINRK